MKKRKKTVWFITLNYSSWYTCRGCHSARTAKLAAKKQGGSLYATSSFKRINTNRK